MVEWIAKRSHLPPDHARNRQQGGKIGGKRSLETMTPEEQSARAKKASAGAAKNRTATRLARERAAKRAPRAKSARADK
jgi:hypothetical protein